MSTEGDGSKGDLIWPSGAVISRRAALGAALALGGVACAQASSGLSRAFGRRVLGREIVPPGSILGATASLGHRLRRADFPAPSLERRARCVIVGGGMAGLSAAWWLAKQGVRDVVLLELESELGGNSRSGQNEVSAYPWGAHYVPIPSAESTLVQELFGELGVISGHDATGRPIYDEFYLGADPLERLYLHGRWQEGLVPHRGLSRSDQQQFTAFFAAMRGLRQARGSDGRPAFAIPTALSSRDSAFTALDRQTMADYLAAQGWTSAYLRWYVNYCMRDDFGATLAQVSAWAGIHYFAARRAFAANASPGSVVTWPAGNGWLVEQLRAKVKAQIETQALAYEIREEPGGGATVAYFDAAADRSVRITAAAVIVATPRFVAQRLVPELASRPQLADFTYSPWMVANLTVKNLPEISGMPLAWDNVSYHGQSLGYVVATHQSPRRYQSKETVLTFYQPLTAAAPDVERTYAAARGHADWARLVLNELRPMHPGIERSVERLDVWLWGHGMIRPTPGFITSPALAAAAQPLRSIAFAHADLSGLSIFEEAQYWGVQAARQALGMLAGGKGV